MPENIGVTYELIARHLLVEQEPDPVPHPLPAGADPLLAPFVTVAAELAAGRARAARRSLSAMKTPDPDSDPGAVHRALELAALTLDVNWFPGDSGAVSE